MASALLALSFHFVVQVRQKIRLFVWLGQQNLSRLDVGDEYQ